MQSLIGEKTATLETPTLELLESLKQSAFRFDYGLKFVGKLLKLSGYSCYPLEASPGEGIRFLQFWRGQLPVLSVNIMYANSRVA